MQPAIGNLGRMVMVISKIPPNDSAAYEWFLSQNYPAGDIKVIMADLIHDNRDEMIILERLETDYNSTFGFYYYNMSYERICHKSIPDQQGVRSVSPKSAI